MIAWIAARSAYLSGGFPLYKAIGLGLAFLFIVAVILLLVALAFNLTASGTAKRRKALIMDSPNTTAQKDYPECGDTRLHGLAAADLREIDANAFVYGVRFEPLIIGSYSPSVQFQFDIFNGTVYPISVDPTVSGFISYGDRRLKGEMTLSSEYRPQNLPRGWTAAMKLNLWLNRQEAEFVQSDLDRAQNPAPLFFSFDQLVITIRGGEEFVDLVTPKGLRFRGCKGVDKNRLLR